MPLLPRILLLRQTPSAKWGLPRLGKHRKRAVDHGHQRDAHEKLVENLFIVMHVHGCNIVEMNLLLVDLSRKLEVRVSSVL